MNQSLGDRMMRLRIKQCIPKVKIADHLDVSDVTIGYWERDERMPTLANFIKLCAFLGTTPNYLLGWKEAELGPTVPPQEQIKDETNGK